MPLRQHGPQSFLFCPWVGWGNHKHLFNLVHTFLQVSSANWWSANGICENHRQLCVNWWTLDWYWLNVPCDYVWPDMKRHKLGFTWVTQMLVQRQRQPSVQLRGIAVAPSPGRPTCCAIFFPSFSRTYAGQRVPVSGWGCGGKALPLFDSAAIARDHSRWIRRES